MVVEIAQCHDRWSDDRLNFVEETAKLANLAERFGLSVLVSASLSQPRRRYDFNPAPSLEVLQLCNSPSNYWGVLPVIGGGCRLSWFSSGQAVNDVN